MATHTRQPRNRLRRIPLNVTPYERDATRLTNDIGDIHPETSRRSSGGVSCGHCAQLRACRWLTGSRCTGSLSPGRSAACRRSSVVEDPTAVVWSEMVHAPGGCAGRLSLRRPNPNLENEPGCRLAHSERTRSEQNHDSQTAMGVRRPEPLGQSVCRAVSAAKCVIIGRPTNVIQEQPGSSRKR